MIFLDTDHEWILARDRHELVRALLMFLDLSDDEMLISLAAACLGCDEIDDVVLVEE